MLLPGCPCCTPAGCTCPGLYSGGTSILANTTNTCCSPTKCLPCSITMQFIPGNTWAGGGTDLTDAEKAEIRAALSLTVVAPLTGSPGPYGIAYQHSSYVSGKHLAMDLTISPTYGCDKWFNYFNNLTGYPDSGAWTTLSSGRWISDFSFYALPVSYTYTTGGFSLAEWCGSSFDKTVAWASGPYDSYITVNGTPSIARVRLSGNTVRYTW